MPPKISVITPSYNQGRFIEETILSVIHQNYPNVEHIIIDGGSTDQTKEVLEKYRSQLAYIVSEPDKGQSDAVNKGFAKATGEIICWINSDDYYAPGAFNTLVKAFEDPNVNCVAGYSILFEEGGTEIKASPSVNKNHGLNYHLRFPNINQPATFFRRSVMQEIMPLNVSLHYLMDRELWLKYLLKYGINHIAVTNEVLVYFRMHQSSKSESQEEKFDDDYATILYHLAKHYNIHQIGELLANRFQLLKDYKHTLNTFPDKETIMDMLRFFLLKRGALVYTKKQFDFAKKAYSVLDVPNYKPFPEEGKGMDRIRSIAACKNWLHFKIKRKLALIGK
jgi:glycosyltransferase involved in cell wall biosynthesis